MAKFGLSYDTLRDINPRLIMISLSGFGADSPWRDYVAFGMSTEQMGGFTHLTGYADSDPLFTGTTGGDLFAGVMGANALFAALNHRDRTGEGQHIDFGQVEACSLFVGDAMTAWSLAGVDPGRVGNAHHHYPLQGIYPCCDDRWIAITCKTSAQCAALADLIGDQSIASATGGNAGPETIAAWTASRDHLALMAELQAHRKNKRPKGGGCEVGRSRELLIGDAREVRAAIVEDVFWDREAFQPSLVLLPVLVT